MEKYIFKRASSSFFVSSLLFPREIRKDVFDLYSFLRVADDCVDSDPVKPIELKDLINIWNSVKKNTEIDANISDDDGLNEKVTKNIIRLRNKYDFEDEWIDKFLATMSSDINFESRKTLENSLDYCEGSAEVVGLMMSRIMRLPKKLDVEARMLGRAFQWINFVRDIAEDNGLGRCYFPKNDLKNFKLRDLSEDSAYANQILYKDFIIFQLQRYEEWRDESKKSFKQIPKKHRLPLEVAVELFDWTAKQIRNDPLRIYHQKLKPSRIIISFFVFKQSLRVYFR